MGIVNIKTLGSPSKGRQAFCILLIYLVGSMGALISEQAYSDSVESPESLKSKSKPRHVRSDTDKSTKRPSSEAKRRKKRQVRSDDKKVSKRLGSEGKRQKKRQARSDDEKDSKSLGSEGKRRKKRQVHSDDEKDSKSLGSEGKRRKKRPTHSDVNEDSNEGAASKSQRQEHSGTADATDITDAEVSPPSKRNPFLLDYEVSASLLSTFQQNKIADSKVNRGNAIYLLPQYDLIGEFRPNLTVHYKRNTTFTLRPRLTVQQQRIVKSEPNMAQSKDKQSIFINESFLANIYSDSFQSVIGLQNFQWGPTELLSPSNIIFNDLGINRNFFYETRGKSLVRLNYAPSGQLSLILLAELLENGEKAPAYEDGFRQKGVLKAEFADQTQTNYLGAVLGVKKQNQPSFGLYGNYSTDFGISFYFDGKTGRGSQVLYPAIDAPVGPSFGKSSLSLESYKSTILTGIRYSFESGSDIRVEGVLDQTAWSKEDRDLGVVVLAQAPTERNFKLFIQPGSALPGREFIYTSARIPEFGWRDSLNLNARLLHSLTDSTQLRIVNLDTYLTDQLTFSGGFTTTGMREDGELTQLYRMTVFASLAVNF